MKDLTREPYIGTRGEYNGLNYASSETKLTYMREYNRLRAREKNAWARLKYAKNWRYRESLKARNRIRRWLHKRKVTGERPIYTASMVFNVYLSIANRLEPKAYDLDKIMALIKPMVLKDEARMRKHSAKRRKNS